MILVISCSFNCPTFSILISGFIILDNTLNLISTDKETTYEEIEDGYIVHCKNSNLVAYIDKEDLELVKDNTWNIRDRDNGYSGYKSISTRVKGKTVNMCTLITGYDYCDHIDRNPLNNRRSNLREATHTENMRNCSKRRDNTSGFIGVTWSKQSNMWEAQLNINKKCLHLGKHADKIEALKIRLRAELKYFDLAISDTQDSTETNLVAQTINSYPEFFIDYVLNPSMIRPGQNILKSFYMLCQDLLKQDITPSKDGVTLLSYKKKADRLGVDIRSYQDIIQSLNTKDGLIAFFKGYN